MEIKSQYFAGEESEGLEPKCGIVSVADGRVKGICHLIAVRVCHGGPEPVFLAPWIFVKTLSTGLLYRGIYKKVSHAIKIG